MLLKTVLRPGYLVEDGQVIPPGAAVARTEIQCKEAGVIRGFEAEAIRRILVQRSVYFLTTTVAPRSRAICSWHGSCAWAHNRRIRDGAGGDLRRFLEQFLTPIKPSHEVTCALPYRVSPGAVLQVMDRGLVQRGDNLVLLVFER